MDIEIKVCNSDTTIVKFKILYYRRPSFQFTDLNIGVPVVGANHLIFLFFFLQIDQS